MTVAAIGRRLDALAARLAPPPAAMSALDLAAALGFVADPWQHAVLASDARQIALNCARQSGKSTLAALLGLHAALSRPDALVLAVSPGERQSKLLFKKMLGFYRALGKPIPAEAESKLSLELANGSEIHALPGSEPTIRGFSAVNLLLIDEAARVRDDLMAAVRPMLAVSQGRLVTMSTPFGKRGWWWEAWANGGDDWERYEVPATSIARIDPAWLEQEERAIGSWWFASEYQCLFSEATDQLFRDEDIDAAIDPGLSPLWTKE